MSVTRYELTTKYRGNESWDELEENPEGAYVRHGDYAALEQRLIESERYGRQTDITIDNLEMKLAQMAAENAGLNEKMDKLATWPGIEFYSSAWEFNNGDGNVALEYMCDTETPATDAFLAEVRASAVDEVCLKISNAIINCYQDEQVGLDEAATICGDFAEQIRKGVQS
ncbi:hypothetical protein ACLEZA_17840 [Enterobacter ludwigii]|uniref:hypothetical protein n=1 Tax=Enterobacter ludwigii TaxID=299767 RepID=UPI003974851B